MSAQIAPHQRIQLCGIKGRIEFHILVNAPQGATTRIFIDVRSSLDGAGIVKGALPESDQHQLQGEAFSRAVRGEIAPPFGVEDAMANMRVIDALFGFERSGRWEAVSFDRPPRTPAELSQSTPASESPGRRPKDGMSRSNDSLNSAEAAQKFRIFRRGQKITHRVAYYRAIGAHVYLYNAVRSFASRYVANRKK